LDFIFINESNTRINALAKAACPKVNAYGCSGDCWICKNVGPKFRCDSEHVVYTYTCTLCILETFYLGKTNNSLKTRHASHKSCFYNKKNDSPLFAHMNSCHPEHELDINLFKLKVIDKLSDSIKTNIREAQLIKQLKPAMNRKFELTHI